ncbi:MAG: 50S ribosomal protein L9 [Bacteroidales bacterium]|nr:50S ribosomal protein L9 [Bacteroidales bacterium]
MEIILKEDIAKLGYADEIVNVKNGYARNYLFPNKLAIPATESNKKVLAENLRQRSRKLAKIKSDAEELAKLLGNITVKVNVKATEEGTIYGSITNAVVAEALQNDHNITIDRKKIEVNGQHIKTVGSYKAMVNLHKDVHVELPVEVVAE